MYSVCVTGVGELTFKDAYAIMLGMEKPRVNEPAATLFDNWDEQTGEFDTGQIETIQVAEDILKESHQKAIATHALADVVANPEVEQKVALVTITSAQEALERQREIDDRNDAYGEYSGANTYPFAEALDAYQPWHKRTRQMIEQYQIGSIDRSDIESMSAAHKKAFSQSFFVDLERTKTVKRLIEESDGHIEHDTGLIHELGRGHTAEELLGYARILKGLVRDIEVTGIPGAVRRSLDVPKPPVFDSKTRQSDSIRSRYDEKRTSALRTANADRARRGAARVVRTNKGYGIERL